MLDDLEIFNNFIFSILLVVPSLIIILVFLYPFINETLFLITSTLCSDNITIVLTFAFINSSTIVRASSPYLK
ncbi:hypothetical protein OFQ53_00885 [Brachyspira hyodysenteriae]|nr:hypothetical protein [Brachyspira hyodysenteriae]MCZ9954944.1 hypothetical protein [Brachyspira hyodysenteriae]